MVPSSGRDRSTPLARVSLLAAPLLLGAGIAANEVGERLGAAGQVDRAAFGWFLVVPLVLLSPGAAALTWQTTGRRQLASRLITAMSIAIGIGVEIWLASAVMQVGCTPVHDPSEVLVPALPTAVAAGAAFGLAGIVGIVSVGVGGRTWLVAIRSLVAGAIGLAAFGTIAILVFAATFAGVTCAAPQ